jgi:hypothetical protein
MRTTGRLSGWAWAVLGVLLATVGAHGQEVPAVPVCPLTADALVAMSCCELEALYRQSAAGTLPVGYYPGKAIWLAGSKWTAPLTFLTSLAWQGKDFDPCTMIMTNKNWIPSIKAKVFYGPSWLDGQPSIIMDYAETSKLVWTVRDEIREVAPGLYLGIMFVRRDGGCSCKFRNFFALEAKPTCCH